MKRIAFITDSLHMGGIERALVELLKGFDHNAYRISLFYCDPNGQLIDSIPSCVQIHRWDQTITPLSRYLKSGDVAGFARGLYYRILIRQTKNQPHKVLSYSTRLYPKYSDEIFDCAIAYQINAPGVVISTLEKISAHKKAAFFHGRSGHTKKDPLFWDRLYSNFDRIFCVSEASRNYFCKEFPISGAKTALVHNLVDIEHILRSAALPSPYPTRHTVDLLTVGRLSALKGQNMIPHAARILLDQGYNIHWYLIGDGELKDTVVEEIIKWDVQSNVTLLGTIMDPYPYIKHCDIYVQTSYSEGYCTTTVEAKILEKPIVTTDAPGMREQFVNGKNALIVDAMTPEALAKGIATLIDHPELQQKFQKHLRACSIDNAAELRLLYDFIES